MFVVNVIWRGGPSSVDSLRMFDNFVTYKDVLYVMRIIRLLRWQLELAPLHLNVHLNRQI